MHIFSIVGDDFFKPLTSQYKYIYEDCLKIIYESYRTELSYGIDRELLTAKLSDYFENIGYGDIQFENDEEVLKDSRMKAAKFLRSLKEYGWIEYEYTNDRRAMIIMPNHSVTFMQMFDKLLHSSEMEYQSEISAVYSLLTNEELLARPYPQVIKPAYERTIALFTELKKLNTGIKKYVEELTDGQTPEEIMEHFFKYDEQIGSKAYHRMQTSDNVARFRSTIVRRLKDILQSSGTLNNIIIGYQNIENEDDIDAAGEEVRYMITDIIDHFNSYDEIVAEIEKQHSRYLRSAVQRAKLAFLSSNNIEGKLSTILRLLASQFNSYEDDEIPDDICQIFNIFPQGFISSESLKPIPISKRIKDVGEIFVPPELSAAERENRKRTIVEKAKNNFSRKNIDAYVKTLLKDRQFIEAKELELTCKKDMIRLIFISMYGRDKKSDYAVIPTDERINMAGFSFCNFKIKRRAK